ncbi:hypothetical protein [Draconibacterium sediminis]|uniref:hypothetical protein n=1 Tax=Draconibacterium sediminis TaxID=1544798 RepID=UPI0026EF70E5|nr:hypothetical protein [Draconibacterium sediminis]
MRDDFSNKTKDTLAKRVAWRCSFPGCGRLTIGPGHKDSSDFVNLGEAAHINAASFNGPRFDETMTSEQRKSIDNGIWMCRHHARMIDSDYFNYSSATLRQWKKLAEEETYRLLKELERDDIKKPTTLIAIGQEIVFEGIWKAVNNGNWIFEVDKFVLGDENKLIDFNNSRRTELENYIVIETQGDGRIINGELNWELIEGKYQISLKVADKSPRTTPYGMKDLSAKLEFTDGDLKLVEGEECAKQTIMITLSTDFGDMWYSPDFGSFFSAYYWAFKDNPELLHRLIKLEITRLISIPHQDSFDKEKRPPLDFINRVIEIKIENLEIENHQIPIKLRLEWGDGKLWEDMIGIYIKPKEEITAQNNVYKTLAGLVRDETE